MYIKIQLCNHIREKDLQYLEFTNNVQKFLCNFNTKANNVMTNK